MPQDTDCWSCTHQQKMVTIRTSEHRMLTVPELSTMFTVLELHTIIKRPSCTERAECRSWTKVCKTIDAVFHARAGLDPRQCQRAVAGDQIRVTSSRIARQRYAWRRGARVERKRDRTNRRLITRRIRLPHLHRV